jgi:hypothetical protein
MKNNLVSDILKKKDYESFHWSYPIEIGFTNFNKNFHFEKLDKAKIDKIEQDFIRMFTEESKNKNEYKMKPDRYTHTTFRYMMNPTKGIDIPKMVKSTMNGLRHYREKFNFETFVNDTVPYLDIYALGFTLNHVLNYFFVKGAVSGEHHARFSALFESMFDFDFSKRLRDINLIIQEYEEILKKNGILSRLGKRIENHEIVDGKKSSTAKLCSFGKNNKTNRCKRIIK